MNNVDTQEDANAFVDGADDGAMFQHPTNEPQDDFPVWWKWIFLATVIITPPYFMYYHGGASGRSLDDQYDKALAANLRLQFAKIGELTMDREAVIKFLYKPNWLQVGKTVFKSNCAACHGRDGGGLVGPNLTDDQYKNVRDIGDILTVLQKGAGGGAMPAWNGRLSANELVMVSSYVASLRGTEPTTAKPPEGSPIPPWPEPEPEAPAEADKDASAETDEPAGE